MKKLLSLALALILVLSMSTVAFAEGETTSTNVTYTPTEEFTFEQIKKTYTSEDDVVVNETLSFTSTADASNPDGGTAKLTVENLEVSSLTPGFIKVKVPALSVAGKYEWTIKEEKGTTAGVTYTDSEIHIVVLVEYDNANNKLQIAEYESYIKKIDGTKTDTFQNTFASGDFTVAKKVQGNMADKNHEFEIVVTLTSTQPIGTDVSLAGTTVTPEEWTETNGTYTYTSTLNYSEASGAKTFANIPVGVSVTVDETDTADKMNGYTYVSGEETFTINNETNETNKAVVIVNDKSTTVDTGISMDSLPYVLLLAVACIGMVAFVSKKRMARDF